MTLLKHLEKIYPDIPSNELYARIMCGEVLVNGEKAADPKASVRKDASVEFAGRKYVSRGGLKLEKAIEVWGIDCRGKVFVDAGSSTGGFTDCLLQNGADAVHAVDVGYNQLAYALRSDKRVYVHERTNIMDVDLLDPVPDAGVADLSFRSIKGAAVKILNLVRERWMIALVKPQFELDSRMFPGFNGVISDDDLLYDTVCSTAEGIFNEGLAVEDVILSPVKGRRGNREFLFLIREEGGTSLLEIRKKLHSLIFQAI